MTGRARRSLETNALDLASRYSALAGVLVLGFTLRIRGLTEWWLSPDEGIYYSTLTRADFTDFMWEVAGNAHPPLYYLILRVLGTLSWDFVWFRLFSLACGMTAIVAVWAAARELVRGVDAHRRPLSPDGATGFDEAAGVLAALLLATSPAAIELSQVMRPYMLLLTGLAGALFFLLHYRNDGPDWALTGYVALVGAALLTHYSALLALGVFGLFIVHERLRTGPDGARWRGMARAQVIPGLIVLGLYFVHLRWLSGTTMADDALNGWLGSYMIGSPLDAWLSHLGSQRLVAVSWLMGPTALFVLAAIVWSSAEGDRTVAIIAGGALLVATAVASLGVYPVGAVRHSTWLVSFTVPAIGWFGGRLLRSVLTPGRRALAGVAVLVVAIGGPLGTKLGVSSVPWTLTDQVLRETDLEEMLEVLDPEGEPDLIVMSSKTFYLLMPFYAREREVSTESDDGWLFHFPYGRREVLVSRSWFFTAGTDRTARRHLARLFPEADAAFPELRVRERRPLVLLLGGGRDPVVDDLVALGEARPIGPGSSGVPGLHAFQLDMPLFLRALGIPSGE